MKKKMKISKALATIGTAILLMTAACENNGVAVEAHALLGGNTFNPIPVKVYVEKSGSLSFAHFEDDPDVAYPVYKMEGGQYQYYFNVKGAETVTYCFNY